MPVRPLATASVDYSLQVTTATVLDVKPGVTPEPSPTSDLFDDAPPSNLGKNPALPVLIGIIPVFLILVGVVVGYRFLLNRRE